MSTTNRFFLTLLLIIVIAIAFAGGFVFGQRIPAISPEEPSGNATPKENLASISEAWDIIYNEYVEPSRLNSANMSRASITGMIDTLEDPYTSYLGQEEYAMSTSMIEGSYTGIGAYVGIKDSKLTIIAPITGSPAEKAGIKAGDIIEQVDGESVDGLSLAEAILKIRGPENTEVTLLILHEGDTQPVEITITRATFDVPSVESEMKGQIAYIRIIEFTGHSADDLDKAYKEMVEQKATGVILDLRGNPGGLLDQVIKIASYFIKEGIVVQVRNRQGEISTHSVDKSTPTTDLPVVVLVDDSSASGSEVLAGAVQDHKRAVIAGTTTYGKGSVNELLQLSDGSGIYITTARWLTPNGRLIEGQGIEPDITLDQTGDDEVQWALDYFNKGG
jgi:carboxyl-terminal processing protease